MANIRYLFPNTPNEVLLDVAFAIHYLHSIGIVHGDVCLGNMLVGRDGHGKLSGFFNSSMVGRESPEEEPKTEGEWRPSVYACRRHASFSSDVYCLGKCFVNAFYLQPDNITDSSRLEEDAQINQTARCEVCAMNPLPDRPEGFGDEQWKLVSDMCCVDPGDRVEMSDVVERLARIVAVSTAIKNEMKSELNLDRTTYQKLQTAILQQVIEYEQEDSNHPAYSSDEDDYDDSCDERETCGLLLTSTSMTSNITILDGLDRRANEAARKIFDDIETVLNDNPPTSKCLYLTFKNPIFRSDVNRGVHPSSQESYERWYISSDNIVEVKRDAETGKGAFASVCKGLWFGAPVMLKKLKQFNDGGQTLRQEANIWYNLRHPHIVSLFGACITSFPLFVSEFVDGTRLEDCKRADEKQLWGYLYDAAIGVQGLHLQNVVHGDLKCDNIMVTIDGRVKLIDFGLSCIQSWGGEYPRGAIQWKSPEWLAGDGPTFASDIYGLGMCIIQAITGSYPWGQMLDPVVRKLVSEGNLPKKRDFFRPREWELVERMCHNDPTIRPAIDLVVCELGEIVSSHTN
ncbi:TKL protein kinase [Phytophthora megakarya]|uniref:TKL protein kinase n=1 Tax=Phytophthora megakarya TaxID=4795 RepID=A0A225VSW2_9STRA|nr:TKL protein kinase [Phytophthora megakarya]